MNIITALFGVFSKTSVAKVSEAVNLALPEFCYPGDNFLDGIGCACSVCVSKGTMWFFTSVCCQEGVSVQALSVQQNKCEETLTVTLRLSEAVKICQQILSEKKHQRSRERALQSHKSGDWPVNKMDNLMITDLPTWLWRCMLDDMLDVILCDTDIAWYTVTTCYHGN